MFKKFLTATALTSFVALGLAQLAVAGPYPPSCQSSCDSNYMRCLFSGNSQSVCQAQKVSCYEFCGIM